MQQTVFDDSIFVQKSMLILEFLRTTSIYERGIYHCMERERKKYFAHRAPPYFTKLYAYGLPYFVWYTYMPVCLVCRMWGWIMVAKQGMRMLLSASLRAAIAVGGTHSTNQKIKQVSLWAHFPRVKANGFTSLHQDLKIKYFSLTQNVIHVSKQTEHLFLHNLPNSFEQYSALLVQPWWG